MKTSRCPSHPSQDKVHASEAKYRQDLAHNSMLMQSAKQGAKNTKTKTQTVVPAFWHVISTNGTKAGGDIPDTVIQYQMNVLNEDYRPLGLSFELKSTGRTVNKTWYDNVMYDTPEQDEMKKTLRRGDVQTLNIYTTGFTNSSMMGYSMFPVDYVGQEWDDGIVIKTATFPGGSMKNYNLGKTVTHEVGHWNGLYHTFQGGCDGDGDQVDDTPAESRETSGCPKDGVKDSCPSAGLDPIHNFMDYSYDRCMTEFTPGQIASMLMTYRNISL